MLKKLVASTAIALSALSLSGCDVFYPHPNQSPTVSESPSASESPSETPSQTPSATPTATTKPRQQQEIRVLQASADSAAGTITVIAEVADISEDGGNCTLTVTQGSLTRQFTAKAESNVTDTQCYPLTVASSGFSSGDASFTVKYESTDSFGTSSPQTIAIP